MTAKKTPNLVGAMKDNMEQTFHAPARLDATEIFHVMDQRDEALIADEVLHGPKSGVFVYNFNISGKDVAGISVRGAAHLARHYGGLKHRLVATVTKTGPLFMFKSYPSEGIPMSVHCSLVPELAEEEDFYEAVVEVTDIKTGNTRQVAKSEKRHEKRRDGSAYDRPNYTTIAESKAYRNAVLSLVPQDVQEIFKKECIKLGKSVDITASIIDEKRTSVIKFAAAKGIALQRDAVSDLDWNQISGLSEAAKESVEAFRASAEALNLIEGKLIEGDKNSTINKEKPAEKKRSTPRTKKADALEESDQSHAAVIPKTSAPATNFNFGD